MAIHSIFYFLAGVPEVSVPSITHLTGTGYTVTLICKVTNAFPEVFRVYWQRYLHGSITVISSASIGIKGVTVESPSLIIPSAMESMTGEYTCFAVNSVGTGSSLPATLTGGIYYKHHQLQSMYNIILHPVISCVIITSIADIPSLCLHDPYT